MMKKIVLVTTLILGSGLAFAQFTGAPSTSAGGYTGPVAGAVSVSEALKMRDDSYVTLRGTITKQVGREKYLFSDGSAEIVVEIDDDDWRGVTIGANNTVEIKGEIDRDFNSIEIDVDSIHKIN